MNGTEITVTFTDGKRRKLKAPETLAEVDGRREVMLVFKTLQVYTGYTDGEIDEAGEITLTGRRNTIAGPLGIGLPFNRLMGWCYKNPKRAKK